MTVMEAITELTDRAIEELGAPLLLVVAGTGSWVSISRYDAARKTKVLLDVIGEPDDHLPLLLVYVGPQDRVQVHRIGIGTPPERVN
jgi:hypothetical protein